MRNIFATIVMIIITATVVQASPKKTYEYILPIEYTNININHEYEFVTATDKNGKMAMYDFNGNKISEDYDNIIMGDRWFLWAKRDGVDYILSSQGHVFDVMEYPIIGISDYNIFVDLSGNVQEGRPMRYFEGEFAICNSEGTQLAVRKYENHKGPISFYWGFEWFWDGYNQNARMIFYENGKYGVINDKYENVIQPVYDLIMPFSNGYAIAVLDGKYGLIDVDGNVKIDFVYDEISSVVDGVLSGEHGYKLMKDGYYGVAATDGTLIYDAVLDKKPVKIYSDHKLVEVCIDNTREDKEEYNLLYGLLDYQGNTVIPIEHTKIIHVSEDRIAAQKTYDKCGFYDIEGNEITEFKYRMISPFSEGIAFVSEYNTQSGEWFEYAIDKEGHKIPELDGFGYSSGFYGGLACVNSDKLIDIRGNVIIDLSENDGLNITPKNYWDDTDDGIYRVTVGEYSGLIKYVDEPVWDYEYIDFENVKHLEATEKGYIFHLENDEKIYINSSGEVTDNIEDLYNKNETDEKYIVKEEGEITKIFNKQGDFLFEIDGYSLREIPCQGAFIVVEFTGDWSENMGLMNDKGEYVIPVGENYIKYLGEDVFLLNDTKVIKLDGTVIAESSNAYVTAVGDNGYIGISDEDFEGFINTKGERVLELHRGYLVQGTFSNGIAPVIKNNVYSRYGETVYIDENGTVMLAPNDKIWYRGGEFRDGVLCVGIGLGKAGTQGANLIRVLYDTPSDWAKETINIAIQNGLVPQELQNRYRKNIKRETFCEIVYQLPFIKEAQSTPLEFNDTKNEKVLHLAGLGIINGMGDGSFAPDKFITREEAAVILDRICILAGITVSGSDERFADDGEISYWAKTGVYNIKNIGIMNGVGENKFLPKSNYTTEQAIATILRVFEMIK